MTAGGRTQMSQGLMLEPGAGRRITGGGLNVTLKTGHAQGAVASTFEVMVPPGFDVGAHVHTEGEELFYVLDGVLDILAFEPLTRSTGNWHDWVSSDGRRFLRGGPGAMIFVPAGCPHAFGNSSPETTTMLFQAAPTGHEFYLQELADLLEAAQGRPAQADIVALRAKYDITQLTTFADN